MYIDTLQMRHSEALIYRQWNGPRYPPKKKQIEALLSTKAYSGTVTEGAKKRMRKAISLLVQKSPMQRIWNPVINKFHKFNIGFITLTIADQGKDTATDVYKKCLAPFLKWFRYRGLNEYVWKAELQERGTIHYHMAVNEFVHWQLVRDKWNVYQKKAGYLDKFARSHKHFRPNSTDVHAVWKVDNVEAYMLKYMSKDEDSTIKGKVWDCSKNLKDGKYFATELTWQNLDLLRTYCKKEIVGEYSTIFRLPAGQQKLILDPAQMLQYRNHLISI